MSNNIWDQIYRAFCPMLQNKLPSERRKTVLPPLAFVFANLGYQLKYLDKGDGLRGGGIHSLPLTPYPQSTYIYRAPQCMSPRWNWDSPTPLAASECALPPDQRVGGGAHSPAAKGVGESQLQRLEKRLALCLLCALTPHRSDLLIAP